MEQFAHPFFSTTAVQRSQSSTRPIHPSKTKPACKAARSQTAPSENTHAVGGSTAPNNFDGQRYDDTPYRYDDRWRRYYDGSYQYDGAPEYVPPPPPVYHGDVPYGYYPGRGPETGARIGARIGGAVGGPEGAAIGAQIGRDIGIEVER